MGWLLSTDREQLKGRSVGSYTQIEGGLQLGSSWRSGKKRRRLQHRDFKWKRVGSSKVRVG
ncbi:hypothetical protein M5K25_020413 [Dendrobium thyrsiflorum]|uniref:Uncharacterized protein n=1 Tax=Dendrobium thyrsiflorum TaxID=117978 RepID=A0ABD0UGV4_DENTH